MVMNPDEKALEVFLKVSMGNGRIIEYLLSLFFCV